MPRRSFHVRWLNFRGYIDTNWRHFRPLTILIGPNAGGKSSLLAPLLLLKQTLDSTDTNLALRTHGDLLNAGSYRDIIHNHELDRELEFRLRFQKLRERAKKIGIGKAPPDRLDLRFNYAGIDKPPQLTRFIVRDDAGRVMLNRSRLESGNYSVRQLPRRLSSGNFSPFIRSSRPYHFLFDVNDVFKRRYERELHLRRDRGDEPTVFDLDASESESMYFAIVSHMGVYVRELLRQVSYLGPLRAKPKRLYEVYGESPLHVGTRGEHAPEIIFRASRSFLRDVNEWVRSFEFGFKLSCKTLTDGAFALTVQRAKESPEVNLADTGFGLSQILPLIVQGLHSTESVVIAEQPEVHLNPRLQAKLADLFVAISTSGNSVLVETHSEHLLLRLRRLVAEQKIKADDVTVLFCERDGDQSTLREIEVRDDGHIDSNEWPKGFFEDSLAEAFALASAQARISHAS